MKSAKWTVWVVVLLFGGLAKVSAVTIFDDAGTHNIDWYIEGDVEVWNDTFFGGVTIVNLLSGGSVTGSLKAYDSSQVNISGGRIIGYVVALANSQITISGESIAGSITAFGSSQITISGGSIGSSLRAFDSSQITISGGSIGGDIYAGLGSTHNTTVTFVGSNFAINGTSVGYGEYDTMGRESVHATLTGTLANGDSLNNGFYIYGDSSIVLFNDPIVPEPYCTEPIVGDLNKDCQVDFADLAILAGNWMTCNLEPQSACWLND